MSLLDLIRGVVASPWTKVLTVLGVIFLTSVALRLADRLIRRYADKLSTTLPLTSLTQNLAKGSILAIGGLIVLNSLGISVTPILTALGLGGLAVALGLQETLSSLFAGIHIVTARQIRIGDYVRLDTGQEGYVVDIAWRTTRLRTLSNSLVVVPNTKLSQAIVTNYDLPSQEIAVLVEVGVDCGSDLEKVERVTVEVAREVMKEVPGGVPDFEPMVRYHTFAESSINFTAVLRGRSFADQYLIKHEFIKRLHRRYAREGIVIPFPTRTILQEKS
ncbi:MAG: mechanosensitive ion channel family protein [Candidatus Omnitrophica bacterium]|nr:mechanosensitive ion channel family protein [Candidatus Omnitrophota bacterium]